jgi:hypothetical protein
MSKICHVNTFKIFTDAYYESVQWHYFFRKHLSYSLYLCPQYITQLVRKHFIDNAIDGIYSINEAKRKMP